MCHRLNVYVLTYNRADYLQQCIESILNQTYYNFELYILDNHSTDHTSQVVFGIDDPRLHYICHEENIGGFGNLIYATQHCTADYFVMFHDDDIMLPSFLEQEMSIMEKYPDVAVVSANAECIDSFGTKTGSVLKALDRPRRYKKEDLFRAYMYEGSTLIFPSLMYRKKVLAEHGILPDKKAGPAGDVIFYCDIARYGGVIYELPDILMLYRHHQGQDTNQSRDMLHVQLFQYMQSDEYYSQLMEKNITGQYHAFNRFIGNEIANYIENMGKVSNFWEIIEAYKACLEYRRRDWCKYRLIIWIARLFPNFANRVYAFYKQRKNLEKR